jgi:hypothetical protein
VHEVTDDEKFLFDLQGFLILRGAIEPDLVAALDQAVVANEAIEHDDSWAEGLPVVTRPLLTKDLFLEHHIRLNGLPRLDPVFDRLIAHPGYLPYLKEFMDLPQLIRIRPVDRPPRISALSQGVHGPAAVGQHLVDLQVSRPGSYPLAPRSASRGLFGTRRQDYGKLPTGITACRPRTTRCATARSAPRC